MEQVLEVKKKTGRPKGSLGKYSEEARKRYCEARGFDYKPRHQPKKSPGRPKNIHTSWRRTQTLANGKTYNWISGSERIINPPNTVYELLAFCIRCREKWPQEIIRCPNCRYMIRHQSRHTKEDVKRY